MTTKIISVKKVDEKVLPSAFMKTKEERGMTDITSDYMNGFDDGKEFIKLFKPKFCPMCGINFEDCICGEPAFSVKWLREKLRKIEEEKN